MQTMRGRASQRLTMTVVSARGRIPALFRTWWRAEREFMKEARYRAPSTKSDKTQSAKTAVIFSARRKGDGQSGTRRPADLRRARRQACQPICREFWRTAGVAAGTLRRSLFNWRRRQGRFKKPFENLRAKPASEMPLARACALRCRRDCREVRSSMS
jgi:hypothetical protein